MLRLQFFPQLSKSAVSNSEFPFATILLIRHMRRMRNESLEQRRSKSIATLFLSDRFRHRVHHHQRQNQSEILPLQVFRAVQVKTPFK
jgi:hypothetical protein